MFSSVPAYVGEFFSQANTATRNHGTVSLAAGGAATSTVTHGLVGTPVNIILSGSDTAATLNYEALGATTFDIRRSSTVAANTISWQAFAY